MNYPVEVLRSSNLSMLEKNERPPLDVLKLLLMASKRTSLLGR